MIVPVHTMFRLVSGLVIVPREHYVRFSEWVLVIGPRAHYVR